MKWLFDSESNRFLKHYELRFRWWHDYYLRRAEEVPGVAVDAVEAPPVPQIPVERRVQLWHCAA